MMISPKLDASLALGGVATAAASNVAPDFAALIASLGATAEQLSSSNDESPDAALPVAVSLDAVLPVQPLLTDVMAANPAPLVPSAPIPSSFAPPVPTPPAIEEPVDAQIVVPTDAVHLLLPLKAVQAVATAPANALAPRFAAQRENTLEASNETVAAVPLIVLPAFLEPAPVVSGHLANAAVFAQMPAPAPSMPSKPAADAKPIDAIETLPAGSAALVIVDVPAARSIVKTETTESVAAPLLDLRTQVSANLPEKAPTPAPERGATFGPLIAEAVRDVLKIANDKDIRFNVRPETLGPVAVTIERGEAGPTLRLGVETPAAVQAVRQAEPLLNDVRGNAPFVQVSVDLASPDGRGKPMRPPQPAQPSQDALTELTTERAATTLGRYA